MVAPRAGWRTPGSSPASSSARLVKRSRLFSTSDCRVSRSASADLLGSFEGAAAGEDGERAKSRCSSVGEEVVAPLDRRPQRLLARIGVAAALEQVEPLREPLEDLRSARAPSCGRRRARPRAAGSRDERRARRSRRSARAGSARRRAQTASATGERRHLVLDLALHAQKLAARDEQREVGAALERAPRARAPPRSPAPGCRGAAASPARRCARRGRPSHRGSGRSSP